MFSIKEISTNLQISTQAIYKQKKELVKQGYMYKNEQGQYKISAEGYNYLKDRQIQRVDNQLKTNVDNSNSQPVDNQQTKTASNPYYNSFSNNQLVIESLQQQIATLNNQLQTLNEEKDYFKAKFEEKDRLLNDYISKHLLTSGASEETNTKKQGFFKRIFGTKEEKV